MREFKYVGIIGLIGCLTLMLACNHEAPLAEPQGHAIDTRVLGTWTALNEHGEVGPKADQITIYPFGKQAYMIIDHGRSPQYFRAYPIRVSGVECVQLELLAEVDEERHLKETKDEDKTPKPFMVVKYELKDGKLLVRYLNPDLAGEDLGTTKSLQKAFKENVENPNLFVEPTTYIR
jgi:hypothetical protein